MSAPKTPRRYGAHVPTQNITEEVASRRATAIQIFCSNPRGWRHPAKTHRLAAELSELVKAGELEVFCHAPYLVNFCSQTEEVRQKSIELIRATLHTAASIRASGLIVHGGQAGPGEHKTDLRYKQWEEAWKSLAETIRETGVRVLVENTAGGEGAAAKTPQGLNRIVASGQKILGKKRAHLVGACIDTAHSWAAGWTLPGVRACTSVELIHANGSAAGHGSGLDRHANFTTNTEDPGAGEDAGELLLNQLPTFYMHAVLQSLPRVPAIVETPGGAEEQGGDILWLEALEAGEISLDPPNAVQIPAAIIYDAGGRRDPEAEAPAA